MNIRWYVVYKKDTGEIIKNLTADEQSIILNTPEDCGFTEGKGRPNEFRVKDDVLVALPSMPDEFSEFDYVKEIWVPNLTLAAQMARQRRDQLLADCDWTQLPDAPLATKEVWATYRQALRDITSQSGFPTKIIWPTPQGIATAPSSPPGSIPTTTL